MPPKITIGIVSFNRVDLLERCLYAIHATSTAEERNIIIWDNGSEDLTPEFLGSVLDWPGVKVYHSKENIGTEAYFRILKMVDTPYFLTLDPDCWIETPGWATNIATIFDNDADLDALMMGQYIDERAHCGITWDGVDYKLAKPRFRCENLSFTNSVIPDKMPQPNSGQLEKQIAGYWIMYSHFGSVIPGTPLTHASTVWRVESIKDCEPLMVSGKMSDISWPFAKHILKNGGTTREWGIAMYHQFYHATGPWWHIGAPEIYWKHKSNHAPDIYHRSTTEQMSWLENAKKWTGWGRPLPGDLPANAPKSPTEPAKSIPPPPTLPPKVVPVNVPVSPPPPPPPPPAPVSIQKGNLTEYQFRMWNAWPENLQKHFPLPEKEADFIGWWGVYYVMERANWDCRLNDSPQPTIMGTSPPSSPPKSAPTTPIKRPSPTKDDIVVFMPPEDPIENPNIHIEPVPVEIK